MENKTQKQKSPFLAALLNLLFFGVGYLYLGKKKTFGALLTIAAVVMGVEYLFGTINLASHFINASGIVDSHSVSIFIIAAALAYDGYKTTKTVLEGK